MHKVHVIRDMDALSPRQEFDNFGTMVCWRARYALGDDHHYGDPDEFIADMLGIDYYDFDGEWWTIDRFDSVMHDRGYLVLPVYLYEHSDLAVNTVGFSCPWDSAQVGWIYATPEQIKAEFLTHGSTVDDARKCLVSETETYNMYLGGDVWGYEIYNADGGLIDSCWGFYGYEHCEQEAKHALGSLGIDDYKILEG